MHDDESNRPVKLDSEDDQSRSCLFRPADSAVLLSDLSAASRVAAMELRSALYSSSKTPELLNAVWGLQDKIHQLTAYLCDHQEEVGDFRASHSGLIRTVTMVLGIARKARAYSLPAVSHSCGQINEHLIEIEYLRERTQTLDASSTA